MRQFGWQLVQRALERPLELALQALGLRAESRRFGHCAGVVALGARRWPAGEAALGLVERDPVEPGREPGSLLEAWKAAPRAHEHLLGDLVRLGVIQAEAPKRAVDATRVDSTSSEKAS